MSPVSGGCLCGAVRFRIDAPPLWTAYCHCRSCRRATGAPVSAFVGAAASSVTFTAGHRAIHDSSPGVRRGFCASCGTPLTYESDEVPGEIHFFTGTFDDPDSLPPALHVWHEEALAWFDTDDALVRHARGSGRLDDR